MENNEKCVILSKKEYDELRSQSNIPSLKIVVDFGYRWRGVSIHVSGTLDPSERLYYQIRRICNECINIKISIIMGSITCMAEYNNRSNCSYRSTTFSSVRCKQVFNV